MMIEERFIRRRRRLLKDVTQFVVIIIMTIASNVRPRSVVGRHLVRHLASAMMMSQPTPGCQYSGLVIEMVVVVVAMATDDGA